MLIGCENTNSVMESDTVAAIEQSIDTNEGASQKSDNTEININNGSEEEIPLNKMQEIVDKIGVPFGKGPIPE